MPRVPRTAASGEVPDVLERVRACSENRAAEAATDAAPMIAFVLTLSLAGNLVLGIWVFIASNDRNSAERGLEDQRQQNLRLRRELAVRVPRR